jgi:hypothetical protein
MLNVMASTAESRNPALISSTRKPDENNVEWLERQLRTSELKREVSTESAPAAAEANGRADLTPTYVILFGGCDRAAFRLRLAQAHVRDDLWPSHWSHVVLLGSQQDDFSKTEIYEISLQMRQGFELSIDLNGLQSNAVSRYGRAEVYPNICVLRLEIQMAAWLQPPSPQVASVLDMFRRQRAVLDAPELVLRWLAFLWGVGHTLNPLFEGHGVPSAVMIDAILSGVGFDISPSVDSRLSSPESFWQTAKWWHDFYKINQAEPINGRYYIHSRIDQSLLRVQTN